MLRRDREACQLLQIGVPSVSPLRSCLILYSGPQSHLGLERACFFLLPPPIITSLFWLNYPPGNYWRLMLVNRSLLLCHLLLHYFPHCIPCSLLKHGLASPSEQCQERMGDSLASDIGEEFIERGHSSPRVRLWAAGFIEKEKLRSWVPWRLLGPGLQWQPLQQFLPPSSVFVFPP